MSSKPDQIASVSLLHGLGVSQWFFLPLDGSRSIWFYPPPHHRSSKWWNVKEWSITAKLCEHHVTGIYIASDLILYFLERVNRHSKCGTNYRRASFQISHWYQLGFIATLAASGQGDKMGHWSWHYSHHILNNTPNYCSVLHDSSLLDLCSEKIWI